MTPPKTSPLAKQLLAGVTTPVKKKAKSTKAKGPVLVKMSTKPVRTAEIKDGTSLIDRTVFLKCRFGVLGNSKKITGSDVLNTDADPSLLKVQKTLLESPELEAIRKADGRMRTWLYNTCLPFEMGIMLLPIGLVETAQERLCAFEEERTGLVDAFIQKYPALCQSAAANLGSLYNPTDYPPAETISARFQFDWQYISFAVPGHLNSISTELFKAEQEKAAQRLQEATDEITLLMRETLYEMVAHLEGRLKTGPDGKPLILRESAVSKLQDFLNTFDLRNITDDRELAVQVAKARELLKGTSADTIRNSDLFREKIRTGMADISASLAMMVTEKPSRKFRAETED